MAKPWIQRKAEDLAVSAASLPAIAAGAGAALASVVQGDAPVTPRTGKTVGDYVHAALAKGLAQPQIEDVWRRATNTELREWRADTPIALAQQRGRERQAPMEAAALEQARIVKERSNVPMAENVRRDLGDIATGGHQLLSLALGTTPHGGEREPGFVDAVSKGIQGRFQAGQELAAGMVGGTVGQYGELLRSPGEALRAQPATWAMEAAPLLGPLARGARRMVAGGRVRDAARIATAAAEGIGNTREAAWSPKPDDVQAARDAMSLRDRVNRGLITPDAAAEIMDRLHPEKVRPVHALVGGIGDAAERARSGIVGAGVGAMLGEFVPGGPVVGAALGAVAPSAAKWIASKVPDTAKAHVSRRAVDQYAQPTPEETIRAREVLGQSHGARGAIVAAGDVAGADASRGVRWSSNTEHRVAVPPSGAVVRTITPDGIGPLPGHAVARSAIAEKAQELGADITRERAVAAAIDAEQDLMIDKTNPARKQAKRDLAFLEERLSKVDESFAKKKAENRAVLARHENRRRYTLEAYRAKAEEMNLALAQSRVARQRYRLLLAEVARADAAGGPPNKKRVLSILRNKEDHDYKNMVDAPADGSPGKTLSQLQKEASDAGRRVAGLKKYLAKVKESRAEFLKEGFYDRFIHERDIEVERRMARRRLKEGYSPEIAARMNERRKLLEERVAADTAAGKVGDAKRMQRHLDRLNRDQAIRESRPGLGIDGLRKLVATLDPMHPQARALKMEAERIAHETRGRPADRRTQRPQQVGLVQELDLLARGHKQKGVVRSKVKLPIRERDLDEAAGLASPPGIPATRSVRTTSPIFEAMVDDVFEKVNFGSSKDKPRFSRNEVGRWMTEPLTGGSLTLLREPSLRGLVEARLTKDLPKEQAVKARAALDDFIIKLTRHALAAEPDTLILATPTGRIDVKSVVGAITAELMRTPDGKAKLGEIRHGAMRRVASHLAVQAEEAMLARSLEQEWQRTSRAQDVVQDAQIPTQDAIKAAARGESMPMLMAVDPRASAERILAAPDVFASSMGITEAQAKAFGKRMMDEYTEVRDPRVQQFLREAESRGDIGKLPTKIYATKGFLESLTARVEGLDSFREGADFAARFSRKAKLGYTALNATTHIHNITSNLVYQSARRGVSPLKLASEWVQTAEQWRNYLRGNDKNYMFRALAKTGFASTNALDAELSHLTMSPPQSILSPVGKAAHVAGRAAEQAGLAYKLGDNIPKLHEATRNFTETMHGAHEIGVGATFRLNLGKGRSATFRKINEFEMRGSDGRVMEIDGHAFQDLVAEASVQPALAIAFDYNDIPLYMQSMKKHGIFGIASPFFTWTYKATDAPGKRGLLSEMLAYTGDGVFATNDPRIQDRRAKAAAMLSLRRTAMFSAARNLLHEDRDELGKAAGWTPRQMVMSHFNTTPSADHMDVTSYDASNPFSASDAVWRMGGAMAAHVFGLGEGAKERMFSGPSLEPQDKQAARLRYLWSKQQSGEWFAPEDALAVIGASGGPILKILKELDSRRDGDVDFGKIGMEFVRMMMGGTVAAAVDVGSASVRPSTGGRREVSITSPDFDQQGAMAQFEPVGDMALRRLFDLGSRSVSVSEAQAFRKKKARVFWRAISKAKEERAKELLLSLPPGAGPGAIEQAKKLDRVYQELMRMDLRAGVLAIQQDVRDLEGLRQRANSKR